MSLQPVILSGGSGTRLWPLSREHYPKQLLALTGLSTLLQATVQRLDGLAEIVGGMVPIAPPLLVCNEEHRFLVGEQLRAIDVRPAAVLLEPEGRNTAPALTLAALAALEDGTQDPVLLVMPADHHVADVSAFQRVVARGYTLAHAGRLVTFGIVPTRAETGYGYIRVGRALDDTERRPAAYELAAFVEKPDAATAARYLASGEYLWNSGLFMMRASVWLARLGEQRPEIVEACQIAFEQGARDRDFYRVAAAAFRACPADSIDYAVMERLTDQAAVVALEAGWSDIGAFAALWEVNEKDSHGNVVRGDVLLHETRGSLVVAESRLVACVGLTDTVVIETPDAILVAHKDCVQQVKEIATRLKQTGRSEHQLHRKVSRPWGSYDGIDAGDRFQVKRIIVNPGAALSLQMHHHRAEHWIVVRGTARVTRGEEVFLLGENQSTYIPLGVVHRLENPGQIPLELVEVQSGAYLGEDDIVRFQDTYGRG